MGRSFREYEFKKLLRELGSKKGRGTELISLYVPPGRNVYDVVKYLRQEYDQAGNIKDKLTRKNVQGAIESIIQRLKLYRKTPPNGLVVFCGAIPRGADRGTEKIEIYVIEPPEPVPFFKYVCDHEFFLDPLEDMVREKAAYGLIVMDRGGAVLAVLRGANYKIVDRVGSDIPPKHSAGGQSQRRFERIREERVHDFFKRLGARATKAFLPLMPELRGIIIGGPGDARERFQEGNFLHYELQKKVIANVPLSYTEEQGVRELIMRAQDLLREVSLFEEREAVGEVFSLLAKNPDMVVYGIGEVHRALVAGTVAKLLMLEDMDERYTLRRCSSCGRGYLLREAPPEWTCPDCGSSDYSDEEVSLIDYLGELAERTGTDVLILTPGTEWGEQLRALGGIVGILRYRSY